MNNQQQTNSKSLDLFALITLLFKWRKFLIIQGIIIAIVSIIIALTVPKTFNSSATLLPPGQFGSLTAFLPQNMTQGLNSVLGSSAMSQSGETSKIMSILYSRNLAEKTINEFNLMERFESETIEDALESFKERVSIVLDEEGSVRVSASLKTDFFHPEQNEQETRLLVAEMCNFIVSELDNIYTSLETQRARYQLQVLEKRYKKNKEDLRELEESYKAFSEKYGVVALPEQTEAMIQNLAQLESQLAIEEVKLEVAKKNFHDGSSEIRTKQILVNQLTDKLKELKKTGSSGEITGPLLPFTETPELALQYVRFERELTVQNLIYEFLTQQVEQLRLQEAKDTPSIQFVDLPQIPTKRSAPTRSLLTTGLFLAGILLVISYIILNAYYFDRFSDFVEKVKDSSED